MNVKPLLLLLVVLGPLAAQDESEGAFVAQVYHNPYLNVLSGLRRYGALMFDRILSCVKHKLLTDPRATGGEIKQFCAGDRYEVVDHVFRQVIDKSFPVFMKIFSQRLFPLRETLPDEIGYFVSRFKFFIKKNFMMFSSLNSASKRSDLHVNKQKFEGLLAALQAEIVLFAKFQSRLKWDKKELIDDIQKLVDQRDDDLEQLRKAKKLLEDQDSESGESGEGSEEDSVPAFLEKTESLIDEQMEMLGHHEDHSEEDSALSHEAKGEKDDDGKGKDFVEQDFERAEGKAPGKKKPVHAHDDHHGSYGGYGAKEPSEGYYVHDGEEPPYTKMEPLRVAPDLDINDAIPGQ